MSRSLSFLLFVAVTSTTVASAQQTDSARAAHLLARATYGARPADITRVQSIGALRWLDEQLNPERINDDAVQAKIARFPTLAMSISDLAREYAPMQDGDTAKRRNQRRILGELVAARLVRDVESERQLEEVMTAFWFNHFNVFWGKGPVKYMVADYENNAIRPFVFGKFYDMLDATAKHPAMLFYLDNAQSNARKGVNENYARELMELHTLGVDGGYTQKDVQEVARAFTGWTIRRPIYGRRNARNMEMPETQSGFAFIPALHDRESKVVLGKNLAAGRGIEDGEDVLKMLARSPVTAHHIARQLIERFVNDTPDSAFVNELAAVFLKTDGDLRAVTRALFTSPRFYDSKNVRAKVKTPFELVVSALRTTGTPPIASPQLLQTLRSMGELPYTEQAPTGFPASSQDWVNSGAMLARMNFGIALGTRLGDRELGVKLGSPEFQMK